MAELLQIILVNLAVSCDNVGVIAIATRHLPQAEAVRARRFGILLSLLLKLLFVGVTSYLFRIPWLHIRIIGGIMLIYVTWNMLRQKPDHGHSHPHHPRKNESYRVAIASIVAADISMSLDNVIAILSIVSADGDIPGLRELLMIFFGLLVSVPVLLWFSGTISALMERYHALTAVCGGYLIYTATRMILEDSTIALFLEAIRFRSVEPIAILAGILAVLASLYTSGAPSPASGSRRRWLALLGFAVAAYAIVVTGAISYLSTGPMVDGLRLTAEMVYGIQPNGANAVYTIGASPHLLPVCACVVAAVLCTGEERWRDGAYYLGRVRRCIGCMAVFILLYLFVVTFGLTRLFGFGSFHPVAWLVNLALQILLHATYVSLFCMMKVVLDSRVVSVTLCMLFVFVENLVVEGFLIKNEYLFFAEFFPDYHILTLPGRTVNLEMMFHIALIAVLGIAAAAWIGYGQVERTGRAKAGAKPLRNY